MESLLDKLLMPLVLVACLCYIYSEFDQAPPEADPPSLAFTPYARDVEPDGRTDESPLLFAAYPCADDCSEHLAGYEWGRESGLSDPDNCEGRSAPFIEGCRVFVEEKSFAVAMSK